MLRPLRLNRFARTLAFVTGTVLMAPTIAHGQAILDQWDAQLWLQVNSQIPVARTWSVILEGQPRWNENFTHYDQVVLRGGLLKRVTPGVQLGAAYAMVPRHTVVGTLLEHQAYEQVLLALPRVGHWAPVLRVREDQRYLHEWGEVSHRIREQVRVTRPLSTAPGWTLVLHQELFLNWSDTRLGPARGVDQHRLFTGLQRRLSRDLAVEAGYMWQEVFQLGVRPARHNHIAVVQLLVRPGRFGRGDREAPVAPPGIPGGPAQGTD